MNFPWAIQIAHADASSLAVLRLAPGIEVADDGKTIWLRSKAASEELDTRLAVLPAIGRYEWLPPKLLRSIDRRIPSEQLPEMRWKTLQEWFQLEMPVAAISGAEPARVGLRLVRSNDEREPGLLLTNLDELKQFVSVAAQVRLDRLRFAADRSNRILLKGKPLPPLPGKRFVLRGCIAVPAGFSWFPTVGTDVLAHTFGVSGDALVVWNENGTITRLHSEQFVPVTRSAVRATDRGLTESHEP